MKTILLSVHIALITSVLTFGGPTPQSNQRSAPTKLARFNMGAYLAKTSTILRVNVDKQMGGEVDVELRDAKGNLCFQRTLSPQETSLRLSMDLSELSNGDYLLKVTNGLEMMVRDVKISTSKPTVQSRAITFQ